ncbi:hypothetical protein HLH26_04705 [Gluconacetobacter sp. 1b LMG 1731]|uniref:Twin-arginine translocation signal domain-containing protein n=1 Tax=Gluconacetobacter dulcium TaxID=2729096 RepID=A0A7W4NRR1_9PROT|nr:hypothetical protein [Gluconacetobacter dulcium]MBB2163844.1 hypothetical protein [Gluconacetobacter dulcium]MBB2193170.1 hypothetical protein [Gluconacetobacter dulcium]
MAMRSSTRRDLFTAGAATALAGIAAASFAQPETLSAKRVAKRDTHSDARLIALCDAFTRTRAEIEKPLPDPLPEYGTAEDLRLEAEMDALVTREHEFLLEISRISANSAPGLLAKTRAVQQYLPTYVREYETDDESPEMRIVFSLLDDIAEHASILRDLTA